MDRLTGEKICDLFPYTGYDQNRHFPQFAILTHLASDHHAFRSASHHDVKQEQVILPFLESLEAVLRVVFRINFVAGILEDGFDPLHKIGVIIDNQQLFLYSHCRSPYLF